jgi:hypothetical protein
MFRHSWQLISDASYQQKELVPSKLWKRVHASLALGAFFVWAADKPTRAAHAKQLGRWISQYHDSGDRPTAPERQLAQLGAQQSDAIEAFPVRSGGAASVVTEPEWIDRPLPEAARDAAHTLQVPAGAAEELWAQRKAPKQNARRRADA